MLQHGERKSGYGKLKGKVEALQSRAVSLRTVQSPHRCVDMLPSLRDLSRVSLLPGSLVPVHWGDCSYREKSRLQAAPSLAALLLSQQGRRGNHC